MGDWINLLIGLLRGIATVYDFVTFIPWYMVANPRGRLKQSGRLKAKPVGDDPGGPYRTVDNPNLTTTLFPECETLDDLFNRAVKLYGRVACLGTREQLSEEDELQPNGKIFKKVILADDYDWYSYNEVNERATALGSGLQALGQKPKQNICLFAETRADWMIGVQACFKYNFPVVTLYATLGEEAIVHGINESEVNFVITSADLLPKFKNIMSKLPTVTHLIYMEGFKKPDVGELSKSVNIQSYPQVMELGRKPENINKPPTKPVKTDLAVIMYTSGSTGLPKGVLITHENLAAGMSGQCQRVPGLGLGDIYIGYLPLAHVLELACEISCLVHGVSIGYSSPQTITSQTKISEKIEGQLRSFCLVETKEDTYIGYLPLAHVLELVAEFACISNGARIGYSSPLTLSDQSTKLKKGCKGDASVLRPTLMAAVPVIMDRLYKAAWDKINSGGPLLKGLFTFVYEYKLKALESGYPTPMLDKYFFSRTKALLGGRIRMMLSGGAPLSKDTQRFMNICFCCPVGQGYGLTETCGAGTVHEVTDISTGKVGAPLQCNEIRLRDWQEGGYTSRDKPNPRGEVLIGGANVTMGYYKNPEKTAEDYTQIDGLRYFCTGDIGQFCSDGTLKIIDRKKDLVKLQAGEYVSLGKVETVLKLSPLVDNICVYADSHKMFTVCIVVPNQKQLEVVAVKYGLDVSNIEEVCQNEEVKKDILKSIQQQGMKGKLEKFEIPQQITLVSEMWTPDTGLVTDAFKLKRKNIQTRYQSDINRMYA